MRAVEIALIVVASVGLVACVLALVWCALALLDLHGVRRRRI